VTEEQEQAPTRRTSVTAILASKEFAEGVRDVRLGRPPRYDDPVASSWNYERGRQWALLAPLSMPLKIGGKVNREAAFLFLRATRSKEIL